MVEDTWKWAQPTNSCFHLQISRITAMSLEGDRAGLPSRTSCRGREVTQKRIFLFGETLTFRNITRQTKFIRRYRIEFVLILEFWSYQSFLFLADKRR